MYRYALLDPRPIPTAEHKNSELLGPMTLGVEVTVPGLAARCGLGHIDPQHSCGNVGRAAIEECVAAPLPPRGATLVTIRPDLDSIGGMAILSLRAEGDEIPPGTIERIDAVARADTFCLGPWPGKKPLPTLEETPEIPGDESFLAGIATAIADHEKSIEKRVAWMKRWLVSGEEPNGYREFWRQEQVALAEQLASGAIRMELVADDRIATVISSHRLAVKSGYRLAPVVVALNPEFRFEGGAPHRKFTVCQWRLGYADLVTVLAELGDHEPGWGGSPTIIGSPQGTGSNLTLGEVIEAVESDLIDGE